MLVAVNFGDYPVLTAVKNLPEGGHSGSRYKAEVPDTSENEAWYKEYRANNDHLPTNWSWESATGAAMMIEALRRTGGDTSGKKLAEAMKDLTIDSPFGVDGKLTMRGEDHTLINYVVGYGVTIAKEPYIKDFVYSSWDQILELEKDWKKRKGYI